MKDYNNLSEDDGNTIVKTARMIVTEYLKNGTKIKLEKEFKNNFSFKSGVFVTLNNNQGLRGCIGYPLPDKLLFNALEDAAISAATKDPRFVPVKYKELDSITFEVTVLTPPKKVIVSKPEEYLSQIKVGRDGLIVKHGFYSGLLLPQVPIEYGWNEEEFLEYTCEKAGLPKNYWKNSETEIQKFEGIVFKEEKPNGRIIREVL
ncbi:MAG: TIGR00296 family protein [Nitrosopumilales archaeon CG_4_10_14_0_8_um_filter_34_8]|nr:MAG: TIGR00296 family protein [Nitrosopumilales archaeon CG_4_10_14_0_8_um_filter_34_8]